jgi:hypothetical protein
MHACRAHKKGHAGGRACAKPLNVKLHRRAHTGVNADRRVCNGVHADRRYLKIAYAGLNFRIRAKKIYYFSLILLGKYF